MKRIIAILLSLTCMIGLFCGCKEKIEKKEPVKLNLLNCGFEFGMTKEEVRKVGYKNINAAFNEDEFTAYEIEVEPFFVDVEVQPKTDINFNFGDSQDSLSFIYIVMKAASEKDAETILNNAILEYKDVGEYKYTVFKGADTYVAENENIKVYIDYTKEYKKVRIVLAAPGIEIPIY